MTEKYPATVVKSANGEIMGFAFLRAYHPLEAFKKTAEISIFLQPKYTGRGIGANLIDYLIGEAKKMGIDAILANVSSLNQNSIDFHLKNDFRECGRFKKVGRKHGRDFDVIWLQRDI